MYGAAQDELKAEFLRELVNLVKDNPYPILIGGDFNLLRFPNVTSQIFNLECYTLDHHCISCFIAFRSVILEILSNSRTLGESWGFSRFFIFDFYQIIKRGFLVLIIFLSEKYFILK